MGAVVHQGGTSTVVGGAETVVEAGPHTSVITEAIGGPGGGGGGGTFEFTQSVAQSVWTCPHTLGGYPLVQVMSLDRHTIYDGYGVSYPDTSTVVIDHDVPHAGIVMMKG
jgi:hypothetical protein